METVSCNLCGGARWRRVYEKPDQLFHTEEWFNVVECCDCGLGFVNPRPTMEEMSKYYPSHFYEVLTSNLKKDTVRFAAQARYLKRFEESGGKPSILDVGCANGDFLRFMRNRGWAIEGVDISDNAARCDDFNRYKSQFPDIPVDEPHYDAVTAWAVLEHVHDPKACFAKAARVLRPGGLFAFMVPNFGSMVSRRLFFEDVPRHLYFFTEANIRRFVEAAGMTLDVVDMRNPAFVLDPHRFLRYYYARLMGKSWRWPLPPSYSQYIAATAQQQSWRSIVKFSMHSPLGALDRGLAPLVGKIERLLGRYGIVTYVARK